MLWLWILLAVVGGIALIFVLFLALSLSARRAGVGARLIRALSRLIMRFGPTRRLALKAANRAFKTSGELPGGALSTQGMSPQQARQAREMLSSLSDEGREKLFQTAMEMERDNVPEGRKQELMQEAQELVIGDLNLGRRERRAAERAQARMGASRPKPQTKTQARKPKSKKKR